MSSAKGMANRITVNPQVMGGLPCIRGLRMTVSQVVKLVAAGYSTDQILADFPYLEREDIPAALLFAADAANHAVSLETVGAD